MKTISVIPAWNEAKRIASVIRNVKPVVDQVVVVDDCSLDNTRLIAEQEGAVVLRHLVNRDQGAALRTGTKYAIKHGADIIVHFDADGQMRAEDIPVVIQPILNGEADVVFGSRFLDQKTNMPAFKRYVIMPLAKLVNMIFLRVKLTDPQSGFRALSRKAAEQIDWKQDGKAHCSEILALVHKQKLRIVEVPVTIIYHNFGQKLSGGFRILKDMILSKLIN
ncbi:MAG: glycosyltransferase family 2 protein [bacterium]